jgi:guanyl-specific ribonuclease Sa
MFLILKIRRSWHFPIKNAQSYSKYAAKSAGVASRVASRVVQGGVHLFND